MSIELVSRFYDSTHDDEREYSADEWSEVFSFLAGNGVMPGEGKEFNIRQFDPVQMKVFVDPGVCFIRGRYGRLSSTEELSLEPAHSSYDRIDRVVLGVNLMPDSRNMKLYVKTGIAAPEPEAPALERTDTLHELSLSRITVGAGVTYVTDSDIVDERNDHKLCGYSLPFGWLVSQRVTTAPREDRIIRDSNGNIIEIRHYIPDEATGVLRWKETIIRHSNGDIHTVTKIAYSKEGIEVHRATETFDRNDEGLITKVVIK